MMKSIKFLFRPSAADITDDLLPLRYLAFTTKLVKLAPRHSEIPHRFGLVVRLLPAAANISRQLRNLSFCSSVVLQRPLSMRSISSCSNARIICNVTLKTVSFLAIAKIVKLLLIHNRLARNNPP